MRSVLLLSALALVAGCDSSSPAPSGIGDLTLTLNPPPAVSRYALQIQTEEAYSETCGLGTVVEQRGRRVDIEITGAAPSGGCFPAEGPWSTFVDLPANDLAGYRIHLRKDGKTDRYTVVVVGDELPLQLAGEGEFSRVVPPTYPND